MVKITVEKFTVRDTADLERDENGDFIYPEEGTYEREVIAVAPQMTSTPDDPNRKMILTGIEIYDTVDSPIEADDFIIYDGTRFQVDGENVAWENNPNSMGLGLQGKVIPCKVSRG